MDPSTRQTLARIEADGALAAQRIEEHHADDLEAFRVRLVASIATAKQRLLDDVFEMTGEDAFCVATVERANDYVDWLQWSLWDVPYYALSVRPDPAFFERRIGACAFMFLAGRVFDDVIDRHFWYKAKRPTLLNMSTAAHSRADGAEALTILSGLLLISESLLRLADPNDPHFVVLLQRVLASFRRAVVGAILEQRDEGTWDLTSYQRLVYLKNVDFWRCLYTGLDPMRASPLYPFLERYYALAQELNDLEDFPEDARRAQPNLVSLLLGAGEAPAADKRARTSYRLPAAVVDHLARRFVQLADMADELPEVERRIAQLKLGHSLEVLRRHGVIEPAAAQDSRSEAPPDLSQLGWYAELPKVVEVLGPAALEETSCAACDGTDRRRLFEKFGFTHHRCVECSHVYVSPRVRPSLLHHMGMQHEEDDTDNEFLEVQNIFAEPTCHLLHVRARGRRFLDLGFGRGYLMRLARAYGFETYGVDSSRSLTEAMVSEFGQRVFQCHLGVDEIPWSAFDVVVMSHVVEHLADPAAVLAQVMQKLLPGGLLYIAVPDIDALHFSVFGKTWDIVSPLAHLQYFNEKSLTTLLERSGFEDLERVSYPPLPKALTPRWMQLFRKLGGDESGELAMIARRPSELALLGKLNRDATAKKADLR